MKLVLSPEFNVCFYGTFSFAGGLRLAWRARGRSRGVFSTTYVPSGPHTWCLAVRACACVAGYMRFLALFSAAKKRKKAGKFFFPEMPNLCILSHF